MRFTCKAAALTAASLILVLVLASAVYGASSDSDSVDVNVNVNDYLSIKPPLPGDVNMGAIAGSGGTATGSAKWTVETNNDNGYSLVAAASGSPTLAKGADSFADYVTAMPNTPEPWVPVATSAFGFSAEGAATPAGTWGTPSSGSGKYRGFNGGTGIQIANNGNETGGEDTTMYFMAEIGAGHLQASGAYTAEVTVTATTL